MVIQGIMDESISENGLFVIGGYLATAPAVAQIAREWDPLRRKFGVLDKDGTYQFKYSELSQPNRRERLLPFYRVIEANILGGLAIAFNRLDLLKAHISLGVPYDLKMTPYQFAVSGLLGVFHTRRDEFFKSQDRRSAKVDFIFDNHSDKRGIDAGWDDFVECHDPKFRPNFGPGPIFRDDKEFLPLQAADFIAGYVRERRDQGKETNFDEWKTHRGFQILTMFADEDDFKMMLIDPAARRVVPLSKHARKKTILEF
jgi:hypothetical protein